MPLTSKLLLALLIPVVGVVIVATVRGVASSPPQAESWGDVDCSDSIDAVDALKILRFIASLPYEAPSNCPEIGEPLAPPTPLTTTTPSPHPTGPTPPNQTLGPTTTIGPCQPGQTLAPSPSPTPTPCFP